MITLFGWRSTPSRYCCRTHFGTLVACMSEIDFLLMATIGERVPVGRA